MAFGRTNAGGGGSFNKSVIIVTAPTGSTVTCSKGEVTKNATEKNGTWTFTGLEEGTWTISASLAEQSATQDVIIDKFDVYYITISYFQATISVTYPAGSTCTCSKDDKTYTAPDTSGTWDCVVDSAGDWTVTITADGEEPVSEVVTITEDGEQKSVMLSYGFWIVREGTEVKTISVRGFVKSQVPEGVKFAGTDYGYHTAYVSSVDLTNLKTMSIDGTFDVDEDSILGIWTNSASGSGLEYSKAVAKSALGASSTSLDVGSFSGLYIVGITGIYNKPQIVKNWHLDR